jgi:hypothetical protein
MYKMRTAYWQIKEMVIILCHKVRKSLLTAGTYQTFQNTVVKIKAC